MAEYTNAEKAERNAKSWDEFVDSLDQDHLPKANIIVAGITGTGKSTLPQCGVWSGHGRNGKRPSGYRAHE